MTKLLGNLKFYIATKLVDFGKGVGKGVDGLASIVLNAFDLDPFDGRVFVFRSKRLGPCPAMVTRTLKGGG